jgi:hypothetical protein
VLRNEIVAKLENGETVEPGEIANELAEVRRAAAREREEEKKLAKKSPEARAKAQARRERGLAAARADAERYQEQRRKQEEDRKAAAELIVRSLNGGRSGSPARLTRRRLPQALRHRRSARPVRSIQPI